MLGLVSVCMDISSELIHSLLPIFMVTSLGASASTLGLIEGVAEATALIVRVFSGAWSDRLGKRKGLIVLGYGLGALSKPLFAIAVSVHWVFAARFIDRLGKGVRSAPRDALIADLAGKNARGAAYGLRQSLDTLGGIIGPLLAIALMVLWAGDFKTVFWFAVVPAVAAVVILVFGVHEPTKGKHPRSPESLIQWRTLKELDRTYWWVVAAGGVFTLARFSEAFLILRAQKLGLADEWAPLVFVLMNVVFGAVAYPIGRLADRVNQPALLGVGLAVLVVADVVLAKATGLPGVAAGVALWGLHMGMTQGLLSTMVADTAPAKLRGTAFGLFNLVSGVAMLIASALAGLLWDRFGAATTFYTGAGFATLALVLLFVQARMAKS
jgi:MFS family permease